MSPRSPLIRLIGWILSALLLLILVALVYGHSGTGQGHLSLADSYITEYQASAPHWPWIIVAIFAFALFLLLLAVGFLLRREASPWMPLGCALIAAASMGLFFVAYTPVRRVEVPPEPPFTSWMPRWWFTSVTARTPYEQGMADAYSDVHYHAIRLVLVTGLAGMILAAAGQLRVPAWRHFAWFTILSAVIMAILFLMGDQLHARHGLWQRLGFATMYAWLLGARWRMTAP